MNLIILSQKFEDEFSGNKHALSSGSSIVSSLSQDSCNAISQNRRNSESRKKSTESGSRDESSRKVSSNEPSHLPCEIFTQGNSIRSGKQSNQSLEPYNFSPSVNLHTHNHRPSAQHYLGQNSHQNNSNIYYEQGSTGGRLQGSKFDDADSESGNRRSSYKTKNESKLAHSIREKNSKKSYQPNNNSGSSQSISERLHRMNEDYKSSNFSRKSRFDASENLKSSGHFKNSQEKQKSSYESSPKSKVKVNVLF